MVLRPPHSTLSPYTTLFRSLLDRTRSSPPPELALAGPRPEILAQAPSPSTAAPGRRARLPGTSHQTPHPQFLRRRPLRRRSEEHTSELQSRENLVCRLLLEK